ncbi:MAG: helix-turn-helix domain-containing protein [Candidatus Cloacimonetes bacterium]|nr:helix-turn-helix domain-containing protein [Candidatus Cloacimonadota bacterium]MBL7107936.1 helix-turn-helix domain-containing protein [Candidatus Cloacimonadota bacterium]
MKTYGKFLKEIREDKNISIEDVSKMTKIKVEHLSAIENENIDDVLIPSYARMKVLNYARYLEADIGKVLKLFDMHKLDVKDKKSILFTSKAKKKYKKKILVNKIVFQIIGTVIFISAIFIIGINLSQEIKTQREKMKASPQEIAQISEVKKIEKEKINENNSNEIHDNFHYKDEELLSKYITNNKKSKWIVRPKFIKEQ